MKTRGSRNRLGIFQVALGSGLPQYLLLAISVLSSYITKLNSSVTEQLVKQRSIDVSCPGATNHKGPPHLFPRYAEKNVGRCTNVSRLIYFCSIGIVVLSQDWKVVFVVNFSPSSRFFGNQREGKLKRCRLALWKKLSWPVTQRYFRENSKSLFKFYFWK